MIYERGKLSSRVFRIKQNIEIGIVEKCLKSDTLTGPKNPKLDLVRDERGVI